MGTRHAGMILHVVLVAAGVALAKAQAAGHAIDISQERLCVTEGAVGNTPDNRLSVDTMKMRAYVHAWTAQSIRARVSPMWARRPRNRNLVQAKSGANSG